MCCTSEITLLTSSGLSFRSSCLILDTWGLIPWNCQRCGVHRRGICFCPSAEPTDRWWKKERKKEEQWKNFAQGLSLISFFTLIWSVGQKLQNGKAVKSQKWTSGSDASGNTRLAARTLQAAFLKLQHIKFYQQANRGAERKIPIGFHSYRFLTFPIAVVFKKCGTARFKNSQNW